MRNRSYIRIANIPQNQDKDKGTFTPVSNQSNKTPRARRRRIKDKKMLSTSHLTDLRRDVNVDNNQYNQKHASSIAFDEPSLSNLSANAMPFKPRTILKRPTNIKANNNTSKPTLKPKPTIPPMLRHSPTIPPMYNHRRNKSPIMRHLPFQKRKNDMKRVNKITKSTNGKQSPAVVLSPPILPRIVKNVKPRLKHNATPPGLRMNKINKINKILVEKKLKMNKILLGNKNKMEEDIEDDRKSIAFLQMLDNMDTNDILNDIGYNNYDFPKHVYGLYTFPLWDQRKDNDSSNWEWGSII